MVALLLADPSEDLPGDPVLALRSAGRRRENPPGCRARPTSTAGPPNRRRAPRPSLPEQGGDDRHAGSAAPIRECRGAAVTRPLALPVAAAHMVRQSLAERLTSQRSSRRTRVKSQRVRRHAAVRTAATAISGARGALADQRRALQPAAGGGTARGGDRARPRARPRRGCALVTCGTRAGRARGRTRNRR